MGLEVNLRHLDRGPLRLQAGLTAADLDLEGVDELIRVEKDVCYDLVVEKVENGILARGSLGVELKCECVRCLKPFSRRLELNEWTCHLALEGEEKVPVVNDCVDLTPCLREDILLEFPQHPLCEPECGGLPKKATGGLSNTGGTGQKSAVLADWTELNKLKL